MLQRCSEFPDISRNSVRFRHAAAYTKDSPLRTQRTVAPPPKSLEPQELRDSEKILDVGSLGQPYHVPGASRTTLAQPPNPNSKADLHAGSGVSSEFEQTVTSNPTLPPPENSKKIPTPSQTISELFPINHRLEEPITGFLFGHPHTNHFTLKSGYE